jgi:hypothetical protein
MEEVDLGATIALVPTDEVARRVVVELRNHSPRHTVAYGSRIMLRHPPTLALSASSAYCQPIIPSQLQCSNLPALLGNGDPVSVSIDLEPVPGNGGADAAAFDTSAQGAGGELVATAYCRSCLDPNPENDVASIEP